MNPSIVGYEGQALPHWFLSAVLQELCGSGSKRIWQAGPQFISFSKGPHVCVCVGGFFHRRFHTLSKSRPEVPALPGHAIVATLCGRSSFVGAWPPLIGGWATCAAVIVRAVLGRSHSEPKARCMGAFPDAQSSRCRAGRYGQYGHGHSATWQKRGAKTQHSSQQDEAKRAEVRFFVWRRSSMRLGPRCQRSIMILMTLGC